MMYQYNDSDEYQRVRITIYCRSLLNEYGLMAELLNINDRCLIATVMFGCFQH